MASSIYTAALMEHNAHPDYKFEMEDATHEHDGINPSCGDEMTLYLKITDDDVIEEASFVGHGCAVSQASADIMAGLIEGQDIAEARRLTSLFIGMIQGKDLAEDDIDDLDEAYELQSISKMPSRVKCAELAWRTLTGILDERDNA